MGEACKGQQLTAVCEHGLDHMPGFLLAYVHQNAGAQYDVVALSTQTRLQRRHVGLAQPHLGAQPLELLVALAHCIAVDVQSLQDLRPWKDVRLGVPQQIA